MPTHICASYTHIYMCIHITNDHDSLVNKRLTHNYIYVTREGVSTPIYEKTLACVYFHNKCSLCFGKGGSEESLFRFLF